MKRLILTILIAGMGIFNALSDGWILPGSDVLRYILPPADATQETWEISYVMLEMDENPESYTINAMRSGFDIYFDGMVNYSCYSTLTDSLGSRSGIFTYNIENAWIKASIKENTLEFENAQHSCDFNTVSGSKITCWFTPSTFEYQLNDGSSHWEQVTRTYPTKEPLILDLEDEETSKYGPPAGNLGFAITDEPDGDRYEGYKIWHDVTTRDWPYGNYGMYYKPCFKRVSSNIIPILSEESNPYYDLMGNRYDELPTKAGIYIHKGKKLTIL